MKVCLYVRVAQFDQTVLDCQVKRLKDFSDKHNLEIVDVATECGSGLRFDRPELSRVETLATNSKIDAVVIANMSHLFRDTFLCYGFVKRMKMYGVKIFTLDSLQRLL